MGYPTVVITEEILREGMQIESVEITIDDKLRLLDAIVDAGLKRIVVGSLRRARSGPHRWPRSTS